MPEAQVTKQENKARKYSMFCFFAHLEGYSNSTSRSSTSPRQHFGAAPPRVPDPSAPTQDVAGVAVVFVDVATDAAATADAAVGRSGDGGDSGGDGGGVAPLGSLFISSKTLSAAPTAWVLHQCQPG